RCRSNRRSFQTENGSPARRRSPPSVSGPESLAASARDLLLRWNTRPEFPLSCPISRCAYLLGPFAREFPGRWLLRRRYSPKGLAVSPKQDRRLVTAATFAKG